MVQFTVESRSLERYRNFGSGFIVFFVETIVYLSNSVVLCAVRIWNVLQSFLRRKCNAFVSTEKGD